MEITAHHPEARKARAAGVRPLVWITSCGKMKRSERSAARDLYTGDVTAKQIAWLETRPGEFGPEPLRLIASAKHGLVEFGDELEPYDETLTAMTRDERAAWSAMVAEQLRERGLTGIRVWALGGAAYTAALRAAVDGRVHNDETTDNPWRTRAAGIGERKRGLVRLLRN